MAPWEVEVDAGVAMFGELALRARLGGTWIKDATQVQKLLRLCLEQAHNDAEGFFGDTRKDAYAYEGPGVSFLMTVSAGISYSKLIWMLNEKANMDCAVKYLPPLAPVSPHELISLHDEGDLQELVRVYHEAKVKGGGRIDIFLEEVEDPYVFEGNFVEGLQGSDASSRCTMGEDEWSLWGPPDDEEAVAGPDTPLLNSRHKEPAPSELGSCAAGISVMEVGKPGVHAQTLHANLVKWLPGEADQQTTEEPEDTADDSFSELAAARFLPAGLFDDCTPPAANPVASQTQGTGCLNLPSHISIFGGSRAEDPNEEWLLEEQERNALAVVKMALGSLDEAGNVGGACVDGGSTAAAQACGAAVAREGSDEPGLAGAGTKPVVLGLGLDHPSFLHMRHAAGELRQHTAARQAGHRAHQLWEAAGSHVQQSQHGTASRMMAPLEGCHEGKYWGHGVPIKVQPWSPRAAESAAAPMAAGLFNPLRGPQQWMSPMGMQWPMGKGLAPTLADADRCMPAQEPQAMHEHQLDQLQPVVRGPTCAPARGGQPALLQPAGAGFSAVPASRGLYGTGGGVRAGIEQPEEQRNKKALGGACAQDRRPFFVEPQSQSPRGAQAPLLSVRKGVAPVKGLAHNGAHRILQSSVKHEKALGSGSFGDVVLCKVRVFGQVAIKFLKVGKASHQQEFWSEADMLARLNHPNVLRFFGYVVDDECSNVVGIATEYADQQSLAELLNDLREWKPGVSPHMSLQQRARFAVAAVRGLQYIHSQDIIHFDLKPENLLLVGETRARACLKVADLGLSRQKLDRSRAVSVGSAMRGTLPYMSPDIIHCPGAVTAATDVWSMGVILHELFTLQAPYGKNSAGSIHRALNRRDDMVQKLDAEGALFQCHCGAQQRGYAQVPDARGYMPFGGSELCQGECRVWRQLILGCLQLDPADRIRLDDMVEMLERLYPQF